MTIAVFHGRKITNHKKTFALKVKLELVNSVSVFLVKLRLNF